MSTSNQSTTVSDPLDRRELARRGKRTRQRREILNNCWYVNRDLRDDLWGWVEHRNISGYPEEYVGILRFTVTDRKQTAQHTKHYATVIDATLVADELATEGHVLVDAALDQFNDWNHNRDEVPFSLGPRQSIAPVVVAPPDNKFRKQVYHEMFEVDPTTDVGATLPV